MKTPSLMNSLSGLSGKKPVTKKKPKALNLAAAQSPPGLAKSGQQVRATYGLGLMKKGK